VSPGSAGCRRVRIRWNTTRRRRRSRAMPLSCDWVSSRRSSAVRSACGVVLRHAASRRPMARGDTARGRDHVPLTRATSIKRYGKASKSKLRWPPPTVPPRPPLRGGLGPGTPRKCTPSSPAAVATTRPPRLRRYFGWSQRSWGWLSISRGIPGPDLVSDDQASSRWFRGSINEHATTTTDKTKAESRGLRLGESAYPVQGFAGAIAQCGVSGRADSGSGGEAGR
jgi:hypothetical protein